MDTEENKTGFETDGDRVTISAPETDEGGGDEGTQDQAAAPSTEGRARDDRGRFSEGKPPTRKDRRDGFQRQKGPSVEDRVRAEVDRREQVLRADFDRRIAEVRQAAQPQQQQTSKDPLEAEIDEVQAGMAREMLLMEQHDPSKGRFDHSRWNSLNKKLLSLQVKQQVQDALKGAQQGQRQDGRSFEERVREDRYARLVSRHPEAREKRFAVLMGMEREELMRQGMPDGDALDDLAANNVRSMLGQRRPARGNERRTIYSQGPGGGTEQRGGYVNDEPESVTVSARELEGLNLPEHLVRKVAFNTRPRR